MDTKKFKEFEPFLKDAFETLPFSFALAGNLMAVLKSQLMEENIRDFPVIALTGAPGSGKTSVARACMAGHEKEFLFTDKVSTVKRSCQNPRCRTNTYFWMTVLILLRSLQGKRRLPCWMRLQGGATMGISRRWRLRWRRMRWRA